PAQHRRAAVPLQRRFARLVVDSAVGRPKAKRLARGEGLRRPDRGDRKRRSFALADTSPARGSLMTARTSQHLADVLRAAGVEDLGRRAETDEFHDFLSPYADNGLALDHELVNLASDGSLTARERIAANNIRARHLNGEFEADEAESEAWIGSEDGQDAMRRLIEGKS